MPWRRSGRDENKYLSGERRMLAESLERAERAAADRTAKQVADEAEALRAKQAEFEAKARLAAQGAAARRPPEA